MTAIMRLVRRSAGAADANVDPHKGPSVPPLCAHTRRACVRAGAWAPAIRDLIDVKRLRELRSSISIVLQGQYA